MTSGWIVPEIVESSKVEVIGSKMSILSRTKQTLTSISYLMSNNDSVPRSAFEHMM